MRSESKNADSTNEIGDMKKKVNESESRSKPENTNNIDAIQDEKMKESETVVTPKTPNVFDGPENEIQFKESPIELPAKRDPNLLKITI